MKIFVASSWKNREKVREMSIRLRRGGHRVYDFTDPSCRKVPETPPEVNAEEFDPEKHKYSEYLKNLKGLYASVMNNQEALRWCELCILLLPCGMDAHADWAYALGYGKDTLVVGQPRKGERAPVHMWADRVIDDVDDVYKYIKENY